MIANRDELATDSFQMRAIARCPQRWTGCVPMQRSLRLRRCDSGSLSPEFDVVPGGVSPGPSPASTDARLTSVPRATTRRADEW